MLKPECLTVLLSSWDTPYKKGVSWLSATTTFLILPCLLWSFFWYPYDVSKGDRRTSKGRTSPARIACQSSSPIGIRGYS